MTEAPAEGGARTVNAPLLGERFHCRLGVSYQSAVSERDLYSVKELAARTGFCEKTIVRCIKRGELPASKLCSEFRVTRDAYLAWVEAGAVEPETTLVVGTVDTASHRVKAVSTVQRYGLRQRCRASQPPTKEGTR